MTCKLCGKPVGEAVRMGAAEHLCGDESWLVDDPAPEPEPVPEDPE